MVKQPAIKQFFRRHFEWVALASALVVIGLMNPYIDAGSSWCLFDMLGVPFCPGEGLGHSIAYTFRGDLSNAMEANIVGPFAIVIIAGRISILLKQNLSNNIQNIGYQHGSND